MIITNDTTTWQVAELMGTEADELDGRIMLSLLTREGLVDTEEISSTRWSELLEESQEIRKRESVGKEYCTQNGEDCATCSLSSYGRDCAGHPIS